ncbi:hypothetical protein FRC10_004746 [Ceratobasidium sp. 414]|nr:hypothetical protein FRC10_004746 [Ceratobasidium sp. 414]
MSTSAPPFRYDAYAHHGRNLIQRYHAKLKKTLGVTPVTVSHMSFRASAAATSADGGAGGLYTALILEDLGIPYRIIEAQDRVGGRLFTYKFQNKTGEPYNYFDVGAMRFPKISSMARVFKLFEYAPLNTGGIALNDKLKPFYFVGGGNNNTFFSYNGVTVRQNAVSSAGQDPFLAKQVIQDVDSAPYIAAGTKAITDNVIEPFATALLKDLEIGGSAGWEEMQKFDLYSTRSYMQLAYKPSLSLNLPDKSLPTDVVNWCETFDKSTGWYDRALSETVLEAVAFGWQPGPNPPRTQWFCVEYVFPLGTDTRDINRVISRSGGAHEIAECMATYIRSRNPSAITLNSRVTSIALNDLGIEIATSNADRHQFSHVISTIPLTVLRAIDLKKAGLSPMQANALRELNYGPSVKIGLQFSTAWWTTGVDLDGKPLNIVGGQSYTDRPLRTVVYPSFGNVKAGATTTLIASYCWTEDAERLGALIDKDDKVVLDLVLRELADIHNVSVDFLRSQLIEYKGWSWSHDPYTMGEGSFLVHLTRQYTNSSTLSGAFAFFGPGKFENLYTSLTTPAAKGYLHFAGEAISVRHAWVEGALDSAWRAVHEMLLFPAFASYREQFYANWGSNPEWVKSSSLAHAPRSIPAKPSAFPVPHNRSQLPTTLPPTEDLIFQHLALTNPDLFD